MIPNGTMDPCAHGPVEPVAFAALAIRSEWSAIGTDGAVDLADELQEPPTVARRIGGVARVLRLIDVRLDLTESRAC